MPEPSGGALPGSFRVAWTPGALRPERVVVAAAPAGAAVRLTSRGADALDALVGGATVDDASHAAGDDARPLVRLLLDAGIVDPRPAGCRYGTADVTVVIPARDAAVRLPHLLAAVAPFPAVVVDDGSVDGTGAIAATHGATVVRNERPAGPAAARNRGVDAVDTPLVAFLDADCEPSPGWIDTLVRHFDDPAVAVAAPRIVARETGGPVLARYEAARSVLDRGPTECRVGPHATVRLVPTAALVVRRAALEDVGGLDERLRYGEDQDLVYRLAAAGWRLRYDPGAEVGHDHRTAVGAFVRRRAGYGTPAASLARRHGALEAAARVPAPELVSIRRELVEMGVPPAVAAAIVRRSAMHSMRSVANAATRAWLVPVALATTGRRAALTAVGAAVVARHAADWRARRPAVGLPAWVALRTLDEAALAAGIWWGAARARTATPLLPTFAAAAHPPGTGAGGTLVERVRWIP